MILTIGFILAVVLLGLETFLCYFLVKKLFYFQDNIGEIHGSLDDFKEHVEKVHELDLYSNEPVIIGMLEHSKEIVSELKDFEKMLYIMRDN